MLILYNFGIKIYSFLLFVFHFFNKKAKLFVNGRRNIFETIDKEVDRRSKSTWFHFASLGEFEQGRPVMEKYKEVFPDKKIIVTFFSPSGYELRKNYTGAEHIYYLPLDTKSNAQRFINLINPELAIFTKYEYWYHYFKTLNDKHIPLYIISGIFRDSQPFFKWYGSLNRKILGLVSHFFVQDEGSKKLLETIHINNVSVSGDTRFDRVAENAASPKQFKIVEDFCGDANVFVAGSTWSEDEKLITELVKDYSSWKFIIAPHEIKDDKIKALISWMPDGSALRYSEIGDLKPEGAGQRPEAGSLTSGLKPLASVLIIDNIGMLSSLYQYGKIAYIGGGFGVGIHNTLEAAAFGVPVIFGPNYQKFLEAKALIANGGGFTISNGTELQQTMQKLQNESERQAAGRAAGQYVQKSKGATEIILDFIKN